MTKRDTNPEAPSPVPVPEHYTTVDDPVDRSQPPAVARAYHTGYADGARDTKDALREAVLEPRRCSDGNCIFGAPKGMHTNGGCRHTKMTRRELVQELRDIVAALGGRS